MILRTDESDLVITLQPDHARLAGVLARHWGNGRVDRPDPYEPACVAAARHDDGWYGWEQAPQVDPATGHPHNFTAMPLETHLGLYGEGVRRVRAMDPYAGLLVSLHIVRLYRPRAAGDGWEARTVGSFIREQEELQAAWRNELCPPGPDRAAFDERVYINHRLLAFWDRLSLVFAMHRLADLDDGLQVPRLPLGYDGDEETAALRHVGGGRVQMEPYPFQVDQLPCTLPVRRIPNRRYPDDAALHQALAGAQTEHVAFTITR